MAVGGRPPIGDDWRLRNSLWILPTVVCCGAFTWASFLFIGVRAKRRSWLIAAGVYGALFIAYFLLVGEAPTVEAPGVEDAALTGEISEAGGSTTVERTWQNNVGLVCFLAAWFGGIVHALIVNKEWLAFVAGSSGPPGSAAATRPAPPIASGSAPAPPTPLGGLADPWRSAVAEAVAAQQRITTTVAGAPSGPMRDRLWILAGHVDSAIDECRRMAADGQRLMDARFRIDTPAVSEQLGRIDSQGPNASLTQARQALQAQLDAASRLDAEMSTTYSGLVLLNARLGEVAARVIELSVRPSAVAEVAAVDTVVESVVDELAAIREALTELDSQPPA